MCTGKEVRFSWMETYRLNNSFGLCEWSRRVGSAETMNHNLA